MTTADSIDISVRLSKREMEVLCKMSEGLSSVKIADTLGVSPRTVHFHLDNIYDKLQANNRVQALNRARKMGILE